jgi:hypothetical protein
MALNADFYRPMSVKKSPEASKIFLFFIGHYPPFRSSPLNSL